MPDGDPFNITDRLLDERGRTHGDFADMARAVQRLKGVIADELGRRHARDQPDLSLGALEALDMIALKLGRILAGQWDLADHWNDISGYARLVARQCPDRPLDRLSGE